MVQLYDIKQNTKVSTIVTNYPLQSISFCADGQHIALGANNSGNLIVYDLRKANKPVFSLEGHKHTVNSVAFQNKEGLTRGASFKSERPN